MDIEDHKVILTRATSIGIGIWGDFQTFELYKLLKVLDYSNHCIHANRSLKSNMIFPMSQTRNQKKCKLQIDI